MKLLLHGEEIPFNELMESITVRRVMSLRVVRRDITLFPEYGEEEVTWVRLGDERMVMDDLLAALRGGEEWDVEWDSHMSRHAAAAWDPDGVTSTQSSCGTCDGGSCEDESGEPLCERVYTLSLRRVQRRECGCPAGAATWDLRSWEGGAAPTARDPARSGKLRRGPPPGGPLFHPQFS